MVDHVRFGTAQKLPRILHAPDVPAGVDGQRCHLPDARHQAVRFQLQLRVDG